MKPPIKFQWRGIHHGYMGAWFIGFGLFFLYMNQNNSLDFANGIYASFIFAGCYLVADDLLEHLVTASTPARKLWEYILWIKNKKEWW